MAVKSLKSEESRVFMLGEQVKCKIIITDDDGVAYTVMDSYSGSLLDNFTLNASVTKSATDKLGSFIINLANYEGKFYNVFDGGEQVIFYADTNAASTEIFRGRIDNVAYGVSMNGGFVATITGRDYPQFTDKTITGTDKASTPALALSRLLYNNYPIIKLAYNRGTTSVSTATYTAASDTVAWDGSSSGYPTTLINLSYQDKKGWSIIKEICNIAGLDCHVQYNTDDSQLYLYTFPIAGITNEEASIAFGVNLISLSDYGIDNNDIYNKVKIYGNQESDNILLLKTEEDTTSQSNLWSKDLILSNADILTMTGLQQKANSELSLNTNITANGRFNVVAMTNISPGDIISCSVPYCGVYGTHKIQEYSHKFGNMFTTTVQTTRKAQKVVDLFVEKLNPDDLEAGGNNINAMVDGYTVFFDEDPSVMTHNGTQETGGILRLESGKTYGIASLTDNVTANYNVGSCEFRRFENYSTDEDIFEVSNDGGTNWEVYSTASGNVHSFTTIGDQITFRMKLKRDTTSATSPAYESVCLLYK